MPKCKLCPIRLDCEKAKEEIMSRHVADMHAYVWDALNFCPLVEQMTQTFEHSVKQMIGDLNELD